MRVNLLLISLLMGVSLLALLPVAHAQQSFFEPVSAAQGRLAATTRAIPNAKLYRLNEAGLRKALANTAKQDERGKVAATTDIPLPNGTTERFTLRETLVMSPELAAANPTIKTYEGEGTIHKEYIIRMSLSGLGLEALIWGVDKDAVYFARASTESGGTLYQSYYARDARKVGATAGPMGDHHCGAISTTDKPVLPGLKAGGKGLRAAADAGPIRNGATVRIFRIAIATTGEWARDAAGVDPTNPTETPLQIRQRAFAVVVSSVNRVNGIYERELASRFQIVNPNLNNEQTNIIFDSPVTDPYSNTDTAGELNTNQKTTDDRVGKNNYDVGHMFGTGGGGVAYKGVLCNPDQKAGGYSAREGFNKIAPQGDPFIVDYFAHELGHQFGMGHTYNVVDADGACTTRSADEAYEVASGSTILSYVGICNDGYNLQQYNDFALPAFHISSITRAAAFLTDEAQGCGTTVGTNTIPTVSAGSAYAIPRLTPFTLTATGADTDADGLSYSWEEFDLAPANGATGFGGTPSKVYDTDDDGVPRPILRAYSPVSSPQRTFPSMAFILNPQNNATPGENQPGLFYMGTHPTGAPGATCPTGQTCIIGERLPSIARIMNFRVSVRDGRGGVADAGTVVTVVNTPGAFRLTSFDNASTVAGNAQQTVTWNVVGTDQAPISCANVAIKLSTDGGLTFPTTLLASTPNDGSEVIMMPNDVTTSTARLRIEAVGNIFFDISNTNFTITPSATVEAPVATANADQMGTVQTAFSYTVNAFTGGQPVTYTTTGLPDGLAFTADSRVISGTPTTSGTSTVTVTGTNSAGRAMTTFAIMVNPTTPTGTFAITDVTTVSCATVTATERRLTIMPQYSGLTGQPIQFVVVNEIEPTMAPGPHTFRIYIDNPTIRLRATQTGTQGDATFTYNWLAVCNGTTPTPEPTNPFAITAVTTLSCEKVTPTERRLTFAPQYSGLTGQPIKFVVINEIEPTMNPGPYSIRVYIDNPTIRLKATQTGTQDDANFTYNWLALCDVTTTPPPASVFAITDVTTVSCATVTATERRLTIMPQYSGLTGQPIQFVVVNEIEPTMAPGPHTFRIYIDNPTIRLRATQTGTQGDATFTYNWLANCRTSDMLGRGARKGSDDVSLSVRVLGNPIVNGRVQVEVAGAAGQPLQLMLTDMRGTIISSYRTEQPAAIETHTIDVGRQPVGTLLLRVSTVTQSKSVTLLKTE